VVAVAIISTAGMAPVFLVNGLSYLFVLGALLVMRPAELRRRDRVPRRRGQIREGIAYAWRTFDLRLPLLVMAVIFTFGFNFSVLLPLLALRTFHGSSSTYGVMLTLFGVGSLIGALAMASHTRRANTRLLATFGLAFGAVTVAVGVAPSLPLEWPLLLLLGAVAISFAITANSTLQLTSSDEMRGRVMSLYTVVFLGSTPVGGFVAGWVGQHLGPRIGLVAGGLLSVAAALAGMAAWSDGGLCGMASP
jgi:predicted MFS family arabinose efflux permease